MSAREGLGDLFNAGVSLTTGKTRVNLRNASGVTIFAVNATSGNVTVNECNAASGGTEQALSVITKYYTQASGVWTKVTQAAASTFTLVTGGLAACYIPAVALSDGFTYVDVTHSAAAFVLLLHGLQVKRAPENLVAVTA